MSNKINSVKEKLINDYIKKIDMAIDNYNLSIEPDEEIVNLLIEIVNVFENDIPNLQGSLLIRTGTEIRDANTTRAILIKYLADSGIEYKGKSIEDFGIRLFIGLKQNYLVWNCWMVNICDGIIGMEEYGF